MTAPTKPTIKRLFAMSGNRCAFPKCSKAIVDSATGAITGHVCHIKGAKPGGPRYDPQQSDDERHGFTNLILRCVPHHSIIDSDEESYTVERLIRMKADHEASSENAGELPDDLAVLLSIAEVGVTGGSVIFASGQIGGQTAHQDDRTLSS